MYERNEDLETKLLAILDEAMRVDAASMGKIRVLNPGTGALEIRAQRGFSAGFLVRFASIEATDRVASARAARLRRRVSVPNLARDPDSEPYWAAALEEGFKAMQATPLFSSDGRVLGTLSTHYRKASQVSQAAALVLDFCARKAAAAIEFFRESPNPC